MLPLRPCEKCGRIHDDDDESCPVPLPEEPDEAPGEDPGEEE